MEYKRTRLDLGVNNNNDNSAAPGTNSSTPSPGASPFNTSLSGGGPHRGKYTRSSLGGTGNSSTGSRFSPYSSSFGRDRANSLRRSVPVIRAQREDDQRPRSGGGIMGYSGISSTAQKIMDTLASISTPVVNAGRVRIDSIKPMMTLASPMLNSSGTLLSASSKFSGPPKTLSPLLLPKSSSGFRPLDNSNWSLKCLSMQPKMVDSSTNTEQQLTPTTNSITTITEEKNPIASEKHQNNQNNLAALIIAQTCPLTNGEFKFDNPWRLEDVDEYLGSDQYTLDMDRELSGSSSSEDGDNEEEGGEENVDSGKSAKNKHNKLPNGDQEINPSSKIKEYSPFKMSTTDKKWECPTCMVSNKVSDAQCVCCATENPNKIENVKISAASMTASKWSCPTCMVPNEASASACVCCSEPNPNPSTGKSSSESTKAPSSQATSSFKFGFGSSTSSLTNTTQSSSGFKFGAPKVTDSTSTAGENINSGGLFGIKPTTTTNGPTGLTSSSTGFTFGAPASKPVQAKIATNSSSSGFKFGLSSPIEMEESIQQKKQTKEYWQCDVCPALNPFEQFSCETCGSPRPHEFDSNYKKPEETPQSEIKFQPVFGAKSQPSSTTFTSSTFTFPTKSAAPVTAANTSLFANSSSFSSGNPFGGGGIAAFGSNNTSNVSTASSTSGVSLTFPSSTTTTTEKSESKTSFSGTALPFGGSLSTTQSGSLSNVPINTTTATAASPPSITGGFQFNPPSFASASPAKRKHAEGADGEDPAKKHGPLFNFSSPSNAPTLKLKENVTSVPPMNPTPAAPAAPVNNAAGFLEALKNASAAVKASQQQQPQLANPTPLSTPSLTSSITQQPPGNKAFQFGITTSLPTSEGFGSSSTLPPANNSFSFGNPTFGSSTSTGLNNSTASTIISAPAAGESPASQFSLTPSFNFGAQSAVPSTFNFGSTAPPPASSTFNFGATAANPPAGSSQPALFQFSSTPSAGTGGGDVGGRRIKKAARRFR